MNMSSDFCLVINTGSSSVKFAVYARDTKAPSYWGQVSNLFSDDATLQFISAGTNHEQRLSNADHRSAVEAVLRTLQHQDAINNLIGVGHRVVHGGTRANKAEFINAATLALIEQCIEFAPLHNPANLAGIHACHCFIPHLPQIAVFDTAFHASLEPVASSYAIPMAWQQQFGIRRFGFHGINHHYIAQATAELFPPTTAQGGGNNVVSAHLGNGCSVCAIKDGRSVDTSMGFTPLEGLIMGTRCGDLDPGLAEYLCKKLNTNIEALTEQLNRNSGLLGVSGVSSDMRQLLLARDQGDVHAALAIEMFCYRLAKYIASYAVPLGSIDMLVFTAGIGEHAAAIRARTVAWLSAFNFQLATDANAAKAQGIRLISTPQSNPIYIIPANEEWMIAQQTFQLLDQSKVS